MGLVFLIGVGVCSPGFISEPGIADSRKENYQF